MKKIAAANSTVPENNAVNGGVYYLLGLAAVLALIVLIRSNFLEIPFERDEGAYSYAGRLILNGAVPFRDIGSQRLSGVFYCYAAIVAVFGYTLKSLHTGFILINLLSAVLIFFTARRLFSGLAALCAAVFWALLSMNSAISGFTVQSEHLVALFFLGGLYCLLMYFDRTACLWAALSGLCFSLAFEVKQTSAFLGLCAGLLLVGRQVLEKPRNVRKGLLSGLVFSAAVFAPIALELSVVWLRGGWEDFNYWFFDIRKEYTSLISFRDGLVYLRAGLPAIYGNYGFIWLASLAGAFSVFFMGSRPWVKAAIAGFYSFGFLTVMPGNHYYGHYFLQWVPAVCLSAAAFMHALEEMLARKTALKAYSEYAVLAVLLAFSAAHLNAMKTYYFSPDYTKILRQVYGLNPFPESKVIADKLNALMKPGDKLAVFGTEIQMYFYTGKLSPSRFSGSGALLEFPVSKSEQWQREFIGDVEKAAPEYLVFYSHPISWMINPKVKNLIFPWFDRFQVKNYDLIGYADMFNDATNYVWAPELDMAKSPPRSPYKIFILKKKG